MLNVQVREPEVARERQTVPGAFSPAVHGNSAGSDRHTRFPRPPGRRPPNRWPTPCTLLSPLGGRGPEAGFGRRRRGVSRAQGEPVSQPFPDIPWLMALDPPSEPSHLGCHTASLESHAPSASLCKDICDYRWEPPGYPKVTSRFFSESSLHRPL